MPEYLAPTLIDKLSDELYNNTLTLGTRRATDWLIRKLREIQVDRYKLMRDNNRLQPRTFVGGMFMWYYDPKHKKTLPYYDTFPLGIVVKFTKTGFYALNLHYISPRERTQFLKKLVGYVNNTAYDETTRFRLTYELLKGVSELDAFKPCFKQYLWSHVKSQFLRIDAYEWYISVLLPVANFRKKRETQVWYESRKIRKHGK